MSIMKAKFFNNWVPKELNIFLMHKFLYKTPHYWGHTSKEGDTDNMFYATDLDVNDNLYKFLFMYFASTIKKDLELLRAYINIQHPGMNGRPHTDDGDITGVYMVTPTLAPGVGCLNIKTTPHDQLQVQLEQNKLCVFDAKQTHWADAPDDEPRITLTFKTREVKNGNN